MGLRFCEMNLHSQVALFYQLKGSNFRHVGCEIKSKQGVSFGVIFSRNGISFVLIHFSGTGVESHITSAEALTTTINVIMYAEFNNVIEIDRNRQVLFDYSA
jgi:hypothetical protein